MKITGPDTRMVKIGANEWVHVRGDAVIADARATGIQSHLNALKKEGKRVLIFELVE
jgi:hypothetical protein